MFFYVYVIESEVDDRWYVGCTINLRRRIEEHNQGQSEYTAKYKPWELIYYEACKEEADAKRREKYLKSSKGKRMLKRRLKTYVYNKSV